MTVSRGFVTATPSQKPGLCGKHANQSNETGHCARLAGADPARLVAAVASTGLTRPRGKDAGGS